MANTKHAMIPAHTHTHTHIHTRTHLILHIKTTTKTTIIVVAESDDIATISNILCLIYPEII